MTTAAELADKRTGLYRLYDEQGQLLYIGISIGPAARMKWHARDKRWWSEVVRKETEWFGTRREAADAELRAIAIEGPRYNSTRTLDSLTTTNCLAELVRRPAVDSIVKAVERDVASQQKGGAVTAMHWTQWISADALAQIADELETDPAGVRAAADTRQILALAEALGEVWSEQGDGTPEGLRSALDRYSRDGETPEDGR